MGANKPAKPLIMEEFTVKAPLQKTWELLSDMGKMSLCIPGCKEANQISEEDWEWLFEVKVLYSTKKIKAKSKATELIPPSHVSFEGKGEVKEGFIIYRVSGLGTMDLEPISDDETKVIFTGSVVGGGGPAGALVNKMISGPMKGLVQKFKENIKAKLEV